MIKLNIQLDVSYEELRKRAIKREVKRVRLLIEYFQKYIDFIDKDPDAAKRNLDVGLYHGLDIVDIEDVRNTFVRFIHDFAKGIDNCIEKYIVVISRKN